VISAVERAPRRRSGWVSLARQRGVQFLETPTPELIRLINRRLPSDNNLILDVTC
jgi:hypothetical protein